MTQTIAQPKSIICPNVLGYVTCSCCGAILGYKRRESGTTWLYVFAHPITGPRPDMASRPVTSRLLDGDIHCQRCDTWQPWVPAADRPWERRKAR